MYIDDDIQFPVLTPNILIHGQPIAIPEEQFGDDDKVIKKGQRYIKCCKDAAWNRWNKEYLRSLRESHNMKNNQRHIKNSNYRDVLLIKGHDKLGGEGGEGVNGTLVSLRNCMKGRIT